MRIICTVCPVGCEMTAWSDSAGNFCVSGNKCRRGEIYSKDEMTNPVRTLTTTVYIKQAERMLPVRSDKPLSKDKMMDYIRQIKMLRPSLPIETGQVLIADIDGNGANITACGEMKGDETCSIMKT